MYFTQQKVLDVLKLNSWNKLSDKKFLKYMEIIPDVNSKVALDIIQTIPERHIDLTIKLTKSILKKFKILMKQNENLQKGTLYTLNAILRSLEYIASTPDITREEMQYVCIEQMELAKIYSKFNKTNKQLLTKNRFKFFDMLVSGIHELFNLFDTKNTVNNKDLDKA